MKLLKKIFTETEMSWKFVILYAIVTGVVVGLLNCVPFLADTSLTYPAVNFEYWFVAAIFVIMNCKSAKEAVIKTFVFFLISQPLIYIVEIPFVSIGWRVLSYYKNWIIPTILTLPGAWIAYQVKRDDILGAVILSVATGFLLGCGLGCVRSQFRHFPYGLIAAIFCFFFGFVLTHILLNNKKAKITGYIVSIIFAIALFTFTVSTATQVDYSYGTELEAGHNWTVVSSDLEASIEDNVLLVHTNKAGTFYVTVENEEGKTIKYKVELNPGSYHITEENN